MFEIFLDLTLSSIGNVSNTSGFAPCPDVLGHLLKFLVEEFDISFDIIIVIVETEHFLLFRFQAIEEAFIGRASSEAEKDYLLKPPGMMTLQTVFIRFCTVFLERTISFNPGPPRQLRYEVE